MSSLHHRHVKRGQFAFGLVTALGGLLTANVQADGLPSLEKALLDQAPKLIEQLRKQGCKNVGVLKFRAQKGNQAVTDNVGLLNLNLAHRLEVALILANPFDEEKQLGILRDASGVAAKTKGANHLTTAGRQSLLRQKYPLAWGKQQVQPDVLLTGVAKIKPDLRSLTVYILAFGKGSEKLQPLLHFEAAPDSQTLYETGASFRLRGVGQDVAEDVAEVQAVDTAARVQAGQETNPLLDPNAPILLEVYYNEQKMPYQLREGQLYLPEPQAGQTVRLDLVRNERSPMRYGIVLTVNGINTLGKQKLPPLESRMWVMGPQDQRYSLRGFQIDDRTAEPFRVLSQPESQARAMYYGADVGALSLVVFREMRGEPEPRLLPEEAEDLAALTRGIYPKKHAPNLDVLKQELRNEASQQQRNVSRGLIESGGQVAGEIRRVTFRPEPVPVLTATVIYYRP